ncbi:MAG TPA: hypothetical protein VMZ71_14440 [Gemmataceae bacterium]|nr:hypothetical protein [Gemmataceae bacterium]
MVQKSVSRGASRTTEPRNHTAAEEVVVTEKVADTVSADAANEHAARPPAGALAIKKPKKARFVREAQEKRPRANTAALPERSTKVSGKMMSRNVTAVPKDEPQTGPKSKSRSRP